jgi:sugar lactone lactonase YvrE
MLCPFSRFGVPLVALTVMLISAEAPAAPSLADPADGTLILVTPSASEQAKLDQVDGLAFDAFGNLLAPLEIFGANGGIVDLSDGRRLRRQQYARLTRPDNVEFGPDGYLYISEDRSAPNSRIIGVAADGTHSVYATGFGQASGMIFDTDGDMYIAEQDLDRVWRVDVPDVPGPFVPTVPALATPGKLLLGLLMMIPGALVLLRRRRVQIGRPSFIPPHPWGNDRS